MPPAGISRQDYHRMVHSRGKRTRVNSIDNNAFGARVPNRKCSIKVAPARQRRCTAPSGLIGVDPESKPVEHLCFRGRYEAYITKQKMYPLTGGLGRKRRFTSNLYRASGNWFSHNLEACKPDQ